MVTILMTSVKMATLGFLEIKLFWNKGYDAIVLVHDVNNKILSSDSKYLVEAIMWPKIGKSSISIREDIITFIW